MKPTILVAANSLERLVAPLADRFTLRGPLQRSEAAAVPKEARDARALITLGGLKTDSGLMDALPQLGLIACYGTGFEGVDCAAARARGIVVTHAGDANAAAVAEFAMGLVLASARNIMRGDRLVRAGRWRGDLIERLAQTPGLAGRRMGIYGLGSIGTKIAQRAAAFDMEIGYHNRAPRSSVPYVYHPDLMGLAAWADFLVVSVRADASNRHAVNGDVLRALGPDGRLINISRGIAVDTTALCEALESGAIAGAGIDVYENEPNVPERLTQLDNAILTPHMAAISASAQRAQRDVMVANLEAFFAGRPVPTPVPG